MAIVDRITGETIERLRGKVDFYLLRGITPVARKWPKKPKPPYTALQAEAMAVFAIANKSMRRLTEHMIEAWRVSSVGKKPSWTDTYRKIIMGYWKRYRVIAPIATDYEVIETDTHFKVHWDILQLYIVPEVEEEIYEITTIEINKEDILKAPKPIYFPTFPEDNIKFVSPYILLDLT